MLDNDVYVEQMVKKARSTKDFVIIAVVFLAALVLNSLLVMLQVSMVTSGAGSIMLIVLCFTAIIWYCVYFVLSRQNVEYEYTLINGQLDIDKIIARKKRKKLISIELGNASVIAGVDDNEHNPNPKNIPVLNFAGDESDGNIYFADVVHNGEEKRILFQPSEKLLRGIKKSNPRNIFINE